MFRLAWLAYVVALISSPPLGFGQRIGTPSGSTLFTDCQDGDGERRVLSPISSSAGGKWHAYVEVDLQSEGCLHTTRLWVAHANGPYRVVYMMPPKRTASANGMEILGWANGSRLLLVKTDEWQIGSDAMDQEDVLAIDPGTGLVYEPDLSAMLKGQDEQCVFRIAEAGFAADKNVRILVRARFSIFLVGDEDADERAKALKKTCPNSEQTWSFDFASGEIKQVANSEPLLLSKK